MERKNVGLQHLPAPVPCTNTRCGPSLVPKCPLPRKRVTGGCLWAGVQAGMGTEAGVSVGRGIPTPWGCSSVRPGAVTGWDRDTLYAGLVSLSWVTDKLAPYGVSDGGW